MGKFKCLLFPSIPPGGLTSDDVIAAGVKYREAQEGDIVAKACPERPGTVRRIHRLWKGASTTSYRVNWHQDDGGWGELGERRISASCFVTVSADGQVTIKD